MNEFERRIKKNISYAKKRLNNDLRGSREAMIQVCGEKIREYQIASDRILGEKEKQILTTTILGSMFQTFSYGYAIGKVEGETLEKIML